MFKFSSSITDFFKPIGQSPSNKRPSPDADLEEQPHQKRRPPPDEIVGRSKVALPSNSANKRDHYKEWNGRVISKSSLAQEDSISKGCCYCDSASTGSASAKADSISNNCCSDDSLTQARSSRAEHNDKTTIETTDLMREEKIGPLDSVPRSSQRVVENGEVVIRSSDDESDSDSSLEDIDGLLARKSVLVSTPPTEPDIALPPEIKQSGKKIRASTRSQKMDAAVASIPRLPPSFRMPPKYEYSLESLVQRTKDEKALEENMVIARSSLDSHEQEKFLTSGDSHGSAWTGGKVDKTLLASVMKKNSGGEEIDRLMMAVQRTEAFNVEETWSFFDDLRRHSSFKEAELPTPNGAQWLDILSDPISREQSFLQGYIGEIALMGNLPEELLMWIIDAVCIETKDDLRNSYIYTVQQARHQAAALLTPTLINEIFQRAGASAEAIDIRRSIKPVPARFLERHETPRSRLLPVLRLINCVSAYLDLDSRIHAICMLSRLLLDISVVRSCETNAAIKTTFSSLIDCISEETQDQELQILSAKIYSFVQNSTLRVQMLQNLPASSPRLSILRRRLSLAFFFGNEDYLRKKAEILLDINAISSQLGNHSFNIRKDTDYTELAALISLLSIGFDSGDPPLPGCDKKAITLFNANIDMLSSSIHAIFTHIVDTGASHMKRTEAKQVLELFQSKLSYDVRTKPKPKTMMFESSKMDGDKESMRNFLNKGVQRSL